ncbi:hypothetical protein DNTS_004986 [Danionella cerebrum]|uniref:C2 domain-containing protein n=1 Tax=Danionella cerebrum TaxID=2873325 RepID=A0A553RLD4_9TELE|nr:hypothetical protein DNTS_004986 [Danionella translucida]
MRPKAADNAINRRIYITHSSQHVSGLPMSPSFWSLHLLVLLCFCIFSLHLLILLCFGACFWSPSCDPVPVFDLHLLVLLNLLDKDTFSKSDPWRGDQAVERGEFASSHVEHLGTDTNTLFSDSLDDSYSEQRYSQKGTKVASPHVRGERLEQRGVIRTFGTFGRTEVIDNTLNPDFVRKYILDYFFEEKQNLRFDLYDVDSKSPDLSKHDFLGQMFCTLGEIVGSPASRLEKPLGPAVRIYHHSDSEDAVLEDIEAEDSRSFLNAQITAETEAAFGEMLSSRAPHYKAITEICTTLSSADRRKLSVWSRRRSMEKLSEQKNMWSKMAFSYEEHPPYGAMQADAGALLAWGYLGKTVEPSSYQQKNWETAGTSRRARGDVCYSLTFTLNLIQSRALPCSEKTLRVQGLNIRRVLHPLADIPAASFQRVSLMISSECPQAALKVLCGSAAGMGEATRASPAPGLFMHG